MRCFYVLVHGKLEWHRAAAPEDELQPRGFYCHRYVLATDEAEAREKAFRRVSHSFEKQTGWTGKGIAHLKLEAAEVTPASVHKLLKPDNLGHSFYMED